MLHSLSTDDLVVLLRRALADPRGFGGQRVEMAPELLEAVAGFANGDARTALSTLEMVVLNGETKGDAVTVTAETVEQCVPPESPCSTTRRGRSTTT